MIGNKRSHPHPDNNTYMYNSLGDNLDNNLTTNLDNKLVNNPDNHHDNNLINTVDKVDNVVNFNNVGNVLKHTGKVFWRNIRHRLTKSQKNKNLRLR